MPQNIEIEKDRNIVDDIFRKSREKEKEMSKRLALTGLLLLGGCTLMAETGYTVGVNADDSGRWNVNVNVSKDSDRPNIQERNPVPVREYDREYHDDDWRDISESRKQYEKMRREEQEAKEEYYREKRKRHEEAEREANKRYKERMKELRKHQKEIAREERKAKEKYYREKRKKHDEIVREENKRYKERMRGSYE